MAHHHIFVWKGWVALLWSRSRSQKMFRIPVNVHLDDISSTVEPSVTKFGMMMHHQTKFCCKRISSSDNILKSNILIILSLTVILTLDTPNHSFWKTIWLIMMHHYTMVVEGSAIQKISGQTFRHFEILLWPWPCTQQSNLSIKHSGLW